MWKNGFAVGCSGCKLPSRFCPIVSSPVTVRIPYGCKGSHYYSDCYGHPFYMQCLVFCFPVSFPNAFLVYLSTILVAQLTLHFFFSKYLCEKLILCCRTYFPKPSVCSTFCCKKWMCIVQVKVFQSLLPSNDLTSHKGACIISEFTLSLFKLAVNLKYLTLSSVRKLLVR